MGWNGSGVFTRTNGTNTGSSLWENDRDAGIKVTTDNHDTHDQDIADGIQACLAKNGENYPSADLPMNNQKHTGVGAATAATHYARADQVQNNAFAWGGTAAGTADAITFNLTPTLTAYTAGLTVRFLANGTTTVTNPTININAAGAKTVKNQDGDALAIGDIVNGTIYEASYDGTDFRIYVADSQDLSDYVTGPASTTENNVPQWDSTTKQLKNGLAVGTSANNLVQLNGSGELPAVSGVNLTGLDIGYPPGFIYNATVTINSTDSEHDLDIQKFSLRNDDNDANIDAGSALVKRMDATFAEGTGNGGMASGESLPTSDFFYVFAVTKDADGTVDIMGDTSSTGANVNAGWTAERLLARVETDASGNIEKVVNYWIGGEWVFDSAEQTITSGGLISVTHGLGFEPHIVSYRLVCKTAESNYSIGDIVGVNFNNTSTGGNGHSTPEINGTSINVRMSSSGTPFKAGNKNSGATFDITSSNWNLVVRARL